jgi:hypothetical protein
MLQKKTTDGEQDNNVAMVLKVDMHCDGCATKITRFLRAFPGCFSHSPFAYTDFCFYCISLGRWK